MILIALGANLPSQFGSPEETLSAALAALEARHIRVVNVSKIWITEPVPASDQPLYRNAVALVETKLNAIELLKILHEIEAEFGRVRLERNEARVIDLDLLAYYNLVLHGDDIEVPHPRMHERAFVLVPLDEVSEEWRHPVLLKSAQELLDLLPDQTYKATMKEVA